MPPDKNQNINLIPGDLERKRQVIKQVIAQAPPEYTVGEINKPAAKPSFWSRIFAFKPKIKSVQPTRLPSRPQLKPLPKPNFLTAQSITSKKVISPPPAPLPSPRRIGGLRPASPPPVTLTPVPPPVPEPAKPIAQRVKKIEMTVAADGETKDAADGENFGVNLLSAEYASAFITQNQKSFFAYAVSGAVILLIGLYISLHLYQLQKSGQVERSQQANTELEGAIASFRDLEKEDQILGRKVGVIKELLAAHISTRAFLEKLEATTIPEVTFLALAAAPAGGITVTARATSYTTLARQLTVLQESAPWIKEVTVAAAGLVHGKENQADSVEFDMVLKVDPNIFKGSEVK